MEPQEFQEPMAWRRERLAATKALLKSLSQRLPFMVIPLVACGWLMVAVFTGQRDWLVIGRQIAYLEMLCSPFYLIFVVLYAYFEYVYTLPDERYEITAQGLRVRRGRFSRPLFYYRHVRDLTLEDREDYLVLTLRIKRPLTTARSVKLAVPKPIWHSVLKGYIGNHGLPTG